MVFSSPIFLFIFLPLTLLGYYLIRKEFRNFFLLLVSLFFYAWAGPKLLLVLLVSIALNYLCGLLISSTKKNGDRLTSVAVTFSIVLNLLLLGYYKYLNFFTDSLNDFIGLNLPLQDIALPLGISFFTFSGISYIMDLNIGKIDIQKNPLKFALYMSFFPKLIQGPISRFGDINRQITERVLSVDKFATGAYRFVIGLSKKMIIADQLGAVVDQIYAVPAINNSVPVAWLGAIGYTLQIFFDFSGYTDMAIGLGKMLGFDLVENFNYPYISTSISEFWRRWHITLSTWFRDYVFYPLEFKRRKVKTLRAETHTLIVFFLTGLWHGASWNFIIWGMWHGIIIALEIFFKSRKIDLKFPKYLKWLLTMLALIIGWVLFRAPDLNYASNYLGVMFGFLKPVNNGLTVLWYLNPKIASIMVVGILASIPWKEVFPAVVKRYEGTVAATIFLDASFVFLLVVSIMLVMSSSYNSFIYFKF